MGKREELLNNILVQGVLSRVVEEALVTGGMPDTIGREVEKICRIKLHTPLDTQTAAEMLGVCVRTIRYWVKRGMPYKRRRFKPGSPPRLFFDPVEIVDWHRREVECG